MKIILHACEWLLFSPAISFCIFQIVYRKDKRERETEHCHQVSLSDFPQYFNFDMVFDVMWSYDRAN